MAYASEALSNALSRLSVLRSGLREAGWVDWGQSGWLAIADYALNDALSLPTLNALTAPTGPPPSHLDPANPGSALTRASANFAQARRTLRRGRACRR